MNGEGFLIDHVISGVVDIDAASARLREEHGLGSVPGGVHLGGTSDRLVPGAGVLPDPRPPAPPKVSPAGAR